MKDRDAVERQLVRLDQGAQLGKRVFVERLQLMTEVVARGVGHVVLEADAVHNVFDQKVAQSSFIKFGDCVVVEAAVLVGNRLSANVAEAARAHRALVVVGVILALKAFDVDEAVAARSELRCRVVVKVLMTDRALVDCVRQRARRALRVRVARCAIARVVVAAVVA